jgi:hypothetical protein
MTDGRDLPWLQDTTETNVQSAWAAEYRDVIILDAWNRPVDPRFNLTTFDLATEVNREVLKELLRRAAVMVDSDEDRIGDDWEERYLGGLGENADSDTDQDHDENLLEYALGSRPDEKSSMPVLATGMVTVDDDDRFFVSFRRRLGAAGGLKYFLERSGTGDVWTDASESMSLSEAENPYDGTATELVTYVVTNASSGSLFRVRVGFNE